MYFFEFTCPDCDADFAFEAFTRRKHRETKKDRRCADGKYRCLDCKTEREARS